MKSHASPRRLLSLVAASFLACAVLTACGGSSEDADELTVGVYNGSIAGALAPLAEEQGFFAEQGIDKVDLVPAKDGAGLGGLLLGNSVQISTMPTAVAMPLISKGQDIVFLTGEFGVDYNLIAGPDVELEHAGEPFPQPVLDVEGKTIGITGRGAVTEVFARTLMTEAGLDADEDVTFVGVGAPSTAVPALESGKVDFLVSFTPEEQLLGADGYQMVVDQVGGDAGDLFSDYMISGYATTQRAIDENPNLVEAFCESIKQADAFAGDSANTEAMNSFIADRLSLDPEQAAQAWESGRGAFDVSLDEQKWNKQSEFVADDVDVSKMPYDKHVHRPCAVQD